MKRYFTFLLVTTTVFFSLSCGTRSVVRTRPYPPQPGVAIDISFFYDELVPYGRWFQVDGYGWVWTPYDVPLGWRPYTHGHWVYTDYGWTWVSRTNYALQGKRAVNRSFTNEPIEQATRRTVLQHRVVDGGAGHQAEQVRGNDVMVYRPNVTPNPPPRPPRNVEPRTQRPSTSAEIERREATERRRLEDYQTRARQTLERQQQEEQRRATIAREEVQRRQEAECRSQQDQARREQEVLRTRQETRRQAEPPPRDTKSTRPQTERKTPPRKPGEKPM